MSFTSSRWNGGAGTPCRVDIDVFTHDHANRIFSYVSAGLGVNGCLPDATDVPY